LWVETEKGKKNPLDAEPNPLGNVVIVKRAADGKEIAKTLGPWLGDEYHDLPHYTSHFATCPQASRWRKREGQ